MIRISRRTEYLIFFGNEHERRVLISSRKKDAGKSGPYHRMSPVFPGAGRFGDKEAFLFEGDWQLILFGPISPDFAADHVILGTRYWLTLGLLNNIIATRDQTHAEKLVEACRKRAVPFDWLKIKNGRMELSTVESFFPTAAASAPLGEQLTKAGPSEIKLAEEELAPLIAAIANRVGQVRASIRVALEAYRQQIESIVRLTRDSAKSGKQRKGNPAPLGGGTMPGDRNGRAFYFNAHGELQKIGSGLSRFAAQSCVAIPPVREHECHYWHHAALGVGTPVLGLFSLVEHIFRGIAEKRITSRFGTLLTQAFPSRMSLPEKLRHSVNIGDVPEQVVTSKAGDVAAALRAKPAVSFPFFSSRDGFQSNAYTISVPVACLAAANNIRWSLCNITHEISHDIIGAILGKYLVPKRFDEPTRLRLRAILEDTNPASIGNHIHRNFLLCALAFMPDTTIKKHAGRLEGKFTVQAELLLDIETAVYEYNTEIEEVMVHAFDYLYFYQSNTERYLRSIWSSWATIPDIERRLRRYLLRSLCAVSLHPSANKEDKYAMREVTNALVALQKSPAIGKCGDMALAYLRKHRAELEARVSFQVDMALLVKRFMFSSNFMAELHGEQGSENFSRFEFTEQTFTNPLAFLARHESREQISAATTAWLFNCLAHNCIPRRHGTRP